MTTSKSEIRRLAHQDPGKMAEQLALAKAVVEALRSVLSEEGVREHLASYVMGVETMNRLEAFDALGEGK